MMTQTFFTTTGIPQVLEPRPEVAQRVMTLEQVETIMEHKRGGSSYQNFPCRRIRNPVLK